MDGQLGVILDYFKWTYPDYDAETYHAFFESAREKLKKQLKV
jgi:hypothetical protein